VKSKIPSLELLPIEAPAADPLGNADDALLAAAKKAAEAEVAVDKYLAAATAEFKRGDVDQPLWDRALAQAKGGDRGTAIGDYLRVRATALKVLKREPQTINYAPVPRHLEDTRRVAPAVPNTVSQSEPVEVKPRAAKYNGRVIAIAATSAGVVVCAAALRFPGKRAVAEPRCRLGSDSREAIQAAGARSFRSIDAQSRPRRGPRQPGTVGQNRGVATYG
jgi:hypothetical protein